MTDYPPELVERAAALARERELVEALEFAHGRLMALEDDGRFRVRDALARARGECNG